MNGQQDDRDITVLVFALVTALLSALLAVLIRSLFALPSHPDLYECGEMAKVEVSSDGNVDLEGKECPGRWRPVANGPWYVCECEPMEGVYNAKQ